MRKLLESMMAKGILSEATWDLDRAVDYIFKKAGLRGILSDLRSGDPKLMKAATDKILGKTILSVSSSKLPGKTAQDADKVNPVRIGVGSFGHGSYYMPTKHEISVSVNSGALKADIGEKAYSKLNYRELIQRKGSFKSVFGGFLTAREYSKFMNKFVKRLDREGLLTKKLQKYPSIGKMIDLTREL